MAKIRWAAFLGMRIMGSRMAANPARAGFELTVWNRTRERSEEVAAAHDARVARTPADAAEGADVAITMVVDSPQVEEVLLGGDRAAETLPGGASRSTCRRSRPRRHARSPSARASAGSSSSTRRCRARSPRPRTER